MNHDHNFRFDEIDISLVYKSNFNIIYKINLRYFKIYTYLETCVCRKRIVYMCCVCHVSYFSIILYFNFSTKSLAVISPAIFGHKRREFPQSRKSVYSSRSGKVRSRVGNFLRRGRFAKSRELPAERRKLEERRDMYRPWASLLSFVLSPRQTREASWLLPCYA